MYIIKVNIHAEDSEYLIFNDVDDIKDFIENNIICDNVDYSNFYDNTRCSLGHYIYILRKMYSTDDIYNIYKNNIVSSHEFGNNYNIIKNFKKMNDNRKYFKKVSFGYNYKIIVNLDFSEDNESENGNENWKLKHVNKNRNEVKDFVKDFIENENDNKDENENDNKDENKNDDFIETKIEDEIEDEIEDDFSENKIEIENE